MRRNSCHPQRLCLRSTRHGSHAFTWASHSIVNGCQSDASLRTTHDDCGSKSRLVNSFGPRQKSTHPKSDTNKYSMARSREGFGHDFNWGSNGSWQPTQEKEEQMARPWRPFQRHPE